MRTVPPGWVSPSFLTAVCLQCHLCTFRNRVAVIATQFNFITTKSKVTMLGGFPGGAVVEHPPANAGDTGSSPGLGRSHMPWSN